MCPVLVPGSQVSNLPDGLADPSEPVLAVRRFDRTHEGRVHQEDFAQVREVAADSKYDRANYAGLGRVIKAICPPDDVVEYVRRLVAMIVMGNADAHLKNWTLRYPAGRQARLSPAYDLVCIAAYPKADQKLAFPLSGTTTCERVTLDSFRALSPSLMLPDEQIASTVRESIAALAASWPQVKRDCPVPDTVVRAVDERLVQLPLMRA
ncbi:hypothetical protein STREPTOSP366_37740 [Streptomyces variabilis]